MNAVQDTIDVDTVVDGIKNHMHKAVARLLDAKQAEQRAAAHRVECEQEVANLIGMIHALPTEGATSIVVGPYKVTHTARLNRTIDHGALRALWSTFPEAMRERIFPITHSLSLRDLRYVERNDPELFRQFSSVITVRPAKASVAVTLATQE